MCRHTQRRRRKLVGLRAVSLTGAALWPLGYDSAGFEYWKFPVSDDLFVFATALGDSDRSEFQRMLLMEQRQQQQLELEPEIGSDAVLAARMLQPRRWKRISDVATICRITDLLGKDANERHLRRSIINEFLIERKVGAAEEAAALAVAPVAAASATATETAAAAAGASSTAEAQQGPNSTDEKAIAAGGGGDDASAAASADTADASAEDATAGRALRKPAPDNTPVALKLQTSKGHDIPAEFVIPQETAFDEEAELEEANRTGAAEPQTEEDFDRRALRYFSFTKGRK